MKSLRISCQLFLYHTTTVNRILDAISFGAPKIPSVLAIDDMWRPYTKLAAAYLPNTSIVIDKYHFIRQVNWAIEKVRKRLQKTMTISLRRYYKRSHSLILARYEILKEEKKQACDRMLLYNDALRLAHSLKAWFYQICQNSRYWE